MNNSMVRDSTEMERICAAVKDAGMFVVLGYSERDGGSLYISQAFISPEGKIVLHRRKIKPTRECIYYWSNQTRFLNLVSSTFLIISQMSNALSGEMGKRTVLPALSPPLSVKWAALAAGNTCSLCCATTNTHKAYNSTSQGGLQSSTIYLHHGHSI